MIAGDGELPAAIAEAARRSGRRVVAVAFPGITTPALESRVTRMAWLGPGELDAALDFLRAQGVREAVMAGKVSKQALLAGRMELDARARALLSGLPDWSDTSLLSAIADEIASAGITLLPQALLVGDLEAPEGVLGRVVPTPDQWRQLALAWPVARALADLDVGQTVVVQGHSVVAVEALEGTDEAIRRAGRLAGPGLCIVKVARPQQDPRFDLPAIGPGTVAAAAEAGAGVLAVEASRSLILEREKVAERAEAAGIALVGVPAAGPDAVSSGEAD